MFVGLAFGCELYVAWNTPRASNSALMHELGHCMLVSAGLDGNGEHDWREYWDYVEGMLNMEFAFLEHHYIKGFNRQNQFVENY